MHRYREGRFRGAKMTTRTTPKGPLVWLGLNVLVLLSGLCTIFGLVVTAAEAWQEHAQARWPEAMARVESCGLDQTSTGRRQMYYIHCRLSYAVGNKQNLANVFSRNAPSSEIWQYPPNQLAPLEEWVDEHPPGTPMAVALRSRPPHESSAGGDRHARGGPRTPSNLKLLEALGGKFLRPADDCANDSTAVPWAKRIFFHAAVPIGCRATEDPALPEPSISLTVT